MQALIIIVLACIIALLGPQFIAIGIWFAMGVACVLIFRKGVADYEANKKKPKAETP